MPEVPDSQAMAPERNPTYVRTDDLLVRQHFGHRCLLIRAKTNHEAFAALGRWAESNDKVIWSVNVERNPYKTGWELLAYYA